MTLAVNEQKCRRLARQRKNQLQMTTAAATTTTSIQHQHRSGEKRKQARHKNKVKRKISVVLPRCVSVCVPVLSANKLARGRIVQEDAETYNRKIIYLSAMKETWKLAQSG